MIYEFQLSTGELVGGEPVGAVVDSLTGERLPISRLTFDSAGNLIGLDASHNRLVSISTTPSSATINGQTVTVLTAIPLTQVGTVDSGTIASFEFSPALGAFVGFDSSINSFVQFLGTNYNSLGGITANTFGTINISGAGYGGRIQATGTGAGNSINAINLAGGGVITGDFYTRGSIGNFGASGDFGGTLLASGDIGAVSISSNLLDGGTVDAGGTLGSLTLSGVLAGSIVAGRAGTIAVGAVTNTGIVDVNRDSGTIGIGSTDSGQITTGSAAAIGVGDVLSAGSKIVVNGDAGSIAVNNGVGAGAKILVGGNLANLVVGNTQNGTISIRRNLGAAVFNAMNAGLLAVGGDITNFVANGNVSNSVISAGVWLGFDGQYNSSDDVIYGGTISNARFNNNFYRSALLAGVLPRIGATSATPNHLPGTIDATTQTLVLNTDAYAGNADATNVADVDSAEAGGIVPSTIGNVVFAGGVDAIGSSVVVAAEGIGSVTASPYLTQRILNNPDGATGILSASRISSSQIDVILNKGIDSSSISSSTVLAFDQNNNQISGLTFGYTYGLTASGTPEGVIHIFKSTGFPTTPVTIALTDILDRVGTRSALLTILPGGTNPFAPLLGTDSITVQ